MARLAVGTLALCLIAAVSACDDSQTSGGATPNGSATREGQDDSASTAIVDCSAAILDRVDPRWRSRSVTRGSFGLYGNARDIRTADRWDRSVFWTKIPVIVDGDRPATLRVSSRDRHRVGLTYGPTAPSPASSNNGARRLAEAAREIRFEPCQDRTPTAWPGGLVLADRERVRFKVRLDGQPWRSISIPG
jgi:hypothetical protein